jgi:hypothetical protein
VKGSEKKMFSSFRFKAKQSEKTFISFRLEAKQKNQKRNEAKRKNFGRETKRKYDLLISLWLEAKNLKWNEAKKNLFFSRERAKRMRNGSRFASFRFEAKKFLKRNRRTLVYVAQQPLAPTKSIACPWLAFLGSMGQPLTKSLAGPPPV